MASLLRNERFPRSSNYDAQWLIEGACGANPLWLAEWLCEDLAFKPGMRVLDLGCGRAKSSIFIAKEFDVDLWAVDLWYSPEENKQRVADHGLDDRVTCLTRRGRLDPIFRHGHALVTVHRPTTQTGRLSGFCFRRGRQ